MSESIVWYVVQRRIVLDTIGTKGWADMGGGTHLAEGDAVRALKEIRRCHPKAELRLAKRTITEEDITPAPAP